MNDSENDSQIEEDASDASLTPATMWRPLSDDANTLIETGVVIALSVFPHLFYSFYDSYEGISHGPLPVSGNFVAILVSCARVTLPLLYIIWRSGERWSAFGILPVKWVRDFLLMIAAYVWTVLLVWGVRWGIYGALPKIAYRLLNYRWPQTGTFGGPHQPSDYLLLIVLYCMIGFGEELVFRGYLIFRFEQIFKSTAQAVVVSTLLFGAMHLYQGWYGVICTTVMGLAYALFFVRFRRLWPIAAAHALIDFIAFARMH